MRQQALNRIRQIDSNGKENGTSRLNEVAELCGNLKRSGIPLADLRVKLIAPEDQIVEDIADYGNQISDSEARAVLQPQLNPRKISDAIAAAAQSEPRWLPSVLWRCLTLGLRDMTVTPYSPRVVTGCNKTMLRPKSNLR